MGNKSEFLCVLTVRQFQWKGLEALLQSIDTAMSFHSFPEELKLKKMRKLTFKVYIIYNNNNQLNNKDTRKNTRKSDTLNQCTTKSQRYSTHLAVLTGNIWQLKMLSRWWAFKWHKLLLKSVNSCQFSDGRCCASLSTISIMCQRVFSARAITLRNTNQTRPAFSRR